MPEQPFKDKKEGGRSPGRPDAGRGDRPACEAGRAPAHALLPQQDTALTLSLLETLGSGQVCPGGHPGAWRPCSQEDWLGRATGVVDKATQRLSAHRGHRLAHGAQPQE